MNRKKIEPGELIEFSFTFEERKLILDETYATDDLTERLKVAVLDGKNIMAKYTLDDMDDLLGYIAFEANHTENKKLQSKLDRLYDKLKTKMESYDDGEWQSSF